MTRRLAPVIGLLVGLGPAAAYAQTNIDQGKTPAQIFANDCAACHKGARGLARGRDSGTLAEFLREHYTTSREQAAALAAYVLGAGGNQSGGTAAQERAQKPTMERSRAPADDSKASERQARRPATPDDGTPATAKPPRPAAEEAKPPEETAPIEESGPTGPARRSATKRNESRSAKGTRGRSRPPEIPPPAQEPAAAMSHEPAAAAAGPSATETPSREATPAPSDAVPQNAASGDATAVPRDNIPD